MPRRESGTSANGPRPPHLLHAIRCPRYVAPHAGQRCPTRCGSPSSGRRRNGTMGRRPGAAEVSVMCSEVASPRWPCPRPRTPGTPGLRPRASRMRPGWRSNSRTGSPSSPAAGAASGRPWPARSRRAARNSCWPTSTSPPSSGPRAHCAAGARRCSPCGPTSATRRRSARSPTPPSSASAPCTSSATTPASRSSDRWRARRTPTGSTRCASTSGASSTASRPSCRCCSQQGQGGHIVNTASMAGLVGMQWLGVYCAAKFAVVGLTESLHRELKPQGIGVSVLCPMIVQTDINRNSVRNRPAGPAQPRRPGRLRGAGRRRAGRS